MTKLRRQSAPEAGFSLIEILFTVGIMGVVTAMAVVQIGGARPSALGDGAMRVVMSQMNTARELAITQRRNMRVSFTLGNRVQIIREEIGAAPTVISSVVLEGGLQFVTATNLPDTPDKFCGASISPVSFPSATGTPPEVKFKPDGSFVNQDGDILNGTVFITMPNQIYTPNASTRNLLSARAVTVLGSTGRVRGYRYDGSACPTSGPISCWKPV